MFPASPHETSGDSDYAVAVVMPPQVAGGPFNCPPGVAGSVRSTSPAGPGVGALCCGGLAAAGGLGVGGLQVALHVPPSCCGVAPKHALPLKLQGVVPYAVAVLPPPVAGGAFLALKREEASVYIHVPMRAMTVPIRACWVRT